MGRKVLLTFVITNIAASLIAFYIGYETSKHEAIRKPRYFYYHIQEIGGKGVKRHLDLSDEWLVPPHSVGDTVYKFGSFSITKNKRYSEQLCRETGIPEKQYVILKIE